jgi:acetyl esterase/lipase
MKWLKTILVLQVLIMYQENVIAQKILNDVHYVDKSTNEQTIDIYLPVAKNFKTILFLHEGSLLGADKKDEPLEEIAKKFQNDGICFVSANYRLGPQNKWPSQPEDVCSAFAWLKKNLSAYAGDTSAIFIMGHSSGAFLAAIVATDSKYLKAEGYSLRSIAGFISVGTQLKPMLPTVSEDKLPLWFEKDNYLKIFGNRSVFDDASPMAHLNADVSKGLIILAESEQFQPPLLQQAKEFIESGMKIGLHLNYEVMPGRTHMSTIGKMPDENDETYSIIKKFVSD